MIDFGLLKHLGYAARAVVVVAALGAGFGIGAVPVAYGAESVADQDPARFRPWLRKENPEELTYTVSLAHENPCGLDERVITQLTDDIFVRARLRNPQRVDQLTLSTTVECERFGRQLLYYVAVEYARLGDENIFVRYGERPWVKLRLGSEEELMRDIKEQIEAAMTAYLRVNFDL